MEIKPELMDWKNLEDTAKAIIRNAKRDLTVWIPVLEQTRKEIDKWETSTTQNPKVQKKP